MIPEAALSIERLRHYVEARRYRGYDPYDALSSPIVRALTMGMKYPRIAATQLLKRFPVNIRPLLGVPRNHNAKGLGLFLWGYAKLFAATQDASCRDRAAELIALLQKNRGHARSGNGWGYDFPWQSRAFYVPPHTPTIVCTSFVGHALLDAYERLAMPAALDLALPSARFILDDLQRTPSGNTFCFGYSPSDRLTVHNANLLGASLLLRLHQYNSQQELLDAAMSALQYSLDRQRDDGSWWYAEPEYQHWIDSFHTGFNLQCIRYFMDHGEHSGVRDAYERGLQFYAKSFFLSDGTAKYFHDRLYPIDTHCYAQALVCLSSERARHQALLDRVARRFIASMQSKQGFFYFQKRKRWTIRVPYMRWSQAWAFHALTSYVLKSS